MRTLSSLLLALCCISLMTACTNTDRNKPIIRGAYARALPVETPHLLVRTSHGEFIMELYPNQAPATVRNFLQYVDEGFYTGTVFHRVMPGFMVQGGGFTKEMIEKDTRAPIRNEAHNGLKNRRGMVAMARTRDRDSATAQFFVNVADNERLDHGVRDYGYAVFGRVIMGMETLDTIAALPTFNSQRFQNLPENLPVIEGIERLNNR